MSQCHPKCFLLLLDDSTYFVAASHRRKNFKPNQPPTPELHDKSALCIEGISYADGKGLLSAAIDLDWCCPQTSKIGLDTHNIRSSTKNKGSEDCGGYDDYGGVYHQCTQDRECQGCIFRRGMHLDNQHECGEEKGEMYYDSDPGEYFAIGTNSSSRLLYTSEQKATQVGTATFRRQRAKLSWSRWQQRQNHPNFGSSASIGSSQDSKPEECFRKQDGQQAHLYDHFSQNHDAIANTLQTGICSTSMMDVKNYVQDALNSRWRLIWHVKNTTKLCDVWIERAYRYNLTEIIEPKLMWRVLSQPNLREQRRLGGTTIHPYRVSLFALRRILPVSNESGLGSILRHSHKEASIMAVTNPNSLLLIRSSLREDYIFEASCAEERDHIVHLLKIATARLVSHAVAGNGDLMIKEYFNEGNELGGKTSNC
ncbi:hypothetical protein ACHAXA_007299 [Cyclostephanos tholiformis]|uniref:Uncharacterized protein n=1 Tax=Cyclostephanos tholiformis TaxID=382380 RepID=A0ABD3RVD6_9STRA